MKDRQPPEFSDLFFRLPDRQRIGQGLGNTLAVDLVGQAQIRTMPRIIGLMAMATGLATAALGGGNRSRTEVAEVGDLVDEVGTLLFQSFERFVSHRKAPVLAYIIRTDQRHKKRPDRFVTFVSHTHL